MAVFEYTGRNECHRHGEEGWACCTINCELGSSCDRDSISFAVDIGALKSTSMGSNTCHLLSDIPLHQKEVLICNIVITHHICSDICEGCHGVKYTNQPTSQPNNTQSHVTGELCAIMCVMCDYL